jgi:hypothetical protein
MATLGAKTTDRNYAVPLVNKTSGDPQGFMDMSSLASVLGVDMFFFENGQNLNNLTFKNRRYLYVYFSPSQTVTQSLLNLPTALNAGFAMIVLAPYGFSPYHAQIITDGSNIYIRRQIGGPSNESEFSPWKQINAEVLS